MNQAIWLNVAHVNSIVRSRNKKQSDFKPLAQVYQVVRNKERLKATRNSYLYSVQFKKNSSLNKRLRQNVLWYPFP